MSGFKLAHTLPSEVPPHDPWTSLIIENMGDGGKLRLDYGTGRSSTQGHRSAHQVDVRVQDVDARTLYIAEGLHLAADELGRRFRHIAERVFATYENKKPRKTKNGQKTRKPKQMWFHLVALDRDGQRLDHANLELTRNDREEVNGAIGDDGGDDFEAVTASEGSHPLAMDFVKRLMRRDEAREAVLLQAVDRSAQQVQLSIEQAKACADQTRANAEQFEALGQALEGFYQASTGVMSKAADMHLEAVVARRDAEYAEANAEAQRTGFWDTAAGQMVTGQLMGLLERAQDPDAVSDFLGRVGAKGFDYYERIKAARAQAKSAQATGRAATQVVKSP